MPDKPKFHLDENVDPDIAEGLRLHGIDVTVTKEVKLRGAKDSTQFDYAQRTGRVLITHDADFLRIASKTSDHCGIVFCKPKGYSIGKIVLDCYSLYHRCSAEELRGTVKYR